MGQTGLMMYRKKKGNQQAMKLPMIRPSISVARLSFFRAILFFSFSASCSLVSLGVMGNILDIDIDWSTLSYDEGPSMLPLAAIDVVAPFIPFVGAEAAAGWAGGLPIDAEASTGSLADINLLGGSLSLTFPVSIICLASLLDLCPTCPTEVRGEADDMLAEVDVPSAELFLNLF